ncbi:MAG: retention module-containing protein, partial [Gammaproteobacteria bacterium]
MQMNEQIKQGNTIESNDGQQIMGFVASTDGAAVVVVSADGTLRELNPGDAIREGDVLQVTDGSHVTITFADGTTRQLDSGGTFVVAQDSFQQLALVDGVEEQNPEFEALLAALNEGQDITEGQEATAAGEAGAAGGSGDEIGQGLYFNLIGGEVTPTAGIDPDYVPPPLLDPTADTDVQEGVPTVSVSVEVEIEIQDPPDGGEPPTIPTDDYPILVSGNAASVLEGTSEGGKEVVFILQLDKPFNQDVTVTYELKPGTADNPADWYDGPLVNTVIIPAGETSFPVTVTIVEDHLDEGNETFDIMILSATNATVNPSSNTATVTIYDDDTTPVANDDENSVQEDVQTTTSGNLITAASPGDVADTDADGDVLVIDAVNGDAANIGNPITGNYGTLTLKADGSYTYELNNDNPLVQGLSEGESLSESFEYTVWDTYNDKQTADLTITIIGTDDQPILAEVDDGSVSEVRLSGDLTSSGLTGALVASDVDVETLTYGVQGGSADNSLAGYDTSVDGTYG